MKNLFPFYLLVFLTFVFSSISLKAQLNLTLQPDATEGKDGRIKENFPDQNFANHPELIAETWTNNGQWRIIRSCIDFDLSSIPDYANVLSARFSLYHNPTSIVANSLHSTDGGSNESYIRRIVEPWDEATLTWNTQPAAVSINQVLIPESSMGNQDYLNIDVTQLVADIISEPNERYGFMLRLIDEGDNYKRLIFASSDHADPNLWPKLEIDYELNTGFSHSSASIVKLEIWPNPVDDYFHWQAPLSASSGSSFELLSTNGELMLSKSVNQNTPNTGVIDCSMLSAGTYLINFGSSDFVSVGSIEVK